MSDDRSAARTKIEFLYQEILGDVSGLITRIEDANKRLTLVAKKTEAAAASIEHLPAKLQTALNASGQELVKDLAQQMRETLTRTELHLQTTARQSAQYAAIAHQSARKMALIALVVGGGAGVIGGLLVGLALGGHFS